MSHARKILRDAVTAALSVTSANVFTKRLGALQDTDLPALVVRSGDETISPQNLNGDLDRRARVTVQGVVQATDDEVQDAVDALIVEVEEVLADFRLAGVQLFQLTGLRVEPDAATSDRKGAFELEYSAQYVTQFGAPQTIL